MTCDRGGRSDRLIARDFMPPCSWPAEGQPLKPRLLAIGASTGGPGSLVSLINTLPRTFDTPIIIVQHIGATFVDGFAKWLEVETGRTTSIASNQEQICRSHMYIAGAQFNLEVNSDLRFHCSQPQETQLYHPSVDVLFQSLARLEVDGSAVVLTGMGNDGATGLKLLADAGWRTYTQSADTCVIDGMPNAAMKLSSRHRRDSVEKIAQAIAIESLAKPRKCHGNI